MSNDDHRIAETVKHTGTKDVIGRAASDMDIFLLVFSGEGSRMFKVKKNARLLVGRSPECDICVVDKSVSRIHAVVQRMGDEIHISDRGSSNGTWINGVKINRRRQMLPGDEVLMGLTHLMVYYHPSAGKTGRKPVETQEVVAADPAMTAVLQSARKIAGGDGHVLITGETGTGKGVVARYIHDHSPRSFGPYIELHCASLSESLIERELFGCEKGAFTGATERMPGFVEASHGGTLFLDEICEVPPSIQVKLLRFLDTGSFSRLGNPKDEHADTRVIAATNRDVKECLKQGVLRQDLYYRLSSFHIELPPLRLRPADIEAFARHFLERSASRHGVQQPTLSQEALQSLKSCKWNGNVRQLRNVIERMVVFSPGEAIGRQEAVKFLDEAARAPAPSGGSIKDRVARTEYEEIQSALEVCGGNQTRAAKMLGISRRTLGYKIKKLGLRP
jgi:DNA-binding NtrC family response regulator